MDHTAFLASSTNTGADPPSMHFLAQAAPVPACLAAHIESEIQPLIDDESAATAGIQARDKTRANRPANSFTASLQWEYSTIQLRIPSCTSDPLSARPMTFTASADRINGPRLLPPQPCS